MSDDVRVEQVASRPLAVIRRRASPRELSTVVPALCGDVWKFVKAHKIDRPGRHVAVYFDGEINLEVGVEVGGTFTGSGSVVPSATPSGTVATVTHIGDYARLGDAHGAIRAFCKQRSLKLAGPNWEIYGHWNDDPGKVTTDVFYLIDPVV
jgi:effector-binding domain-containing protein